VVEESFLRLPTVVVHAVPQDREIDVFVFLGLHQEQVLLVVSVGVHKRDHALYDLRLGVLSNYIIV